MIAITVCLSNREGRKMQHTLTACSTRATKIGLPASHHQRFRIQAQRTFSHINTPVIRTRKNTTFSLIKRANHTEGPSGTKGKARRATPPGPVDINVVLEPYPAATRTRVNMVNPILESYWGRGIGQMALAAGAGNLHTAFHTIWKADNVMLCTGFNVCLDEHGNPTPETDGPVGTAILAYAGYVTGKSVVVVADNHNCHLVREALLILDRACARHVKFGPVSAQLGTKLEQMQAIVDKHNVDAIVHTEVPGRNNMGIYSNMRGIPIGSFNAPLDEVMNIANGLDVPTIGVGDGGNEAGMGGLTGVPKALNGNEMQAVVQAKHQILAWNSNLGAIALAEILLAANGKPRSCSAAQLGQLIERTLNEGGVDGVSRGRILDKVMEHPDYPPRLIWTGVDGFPSDVHKADLIKLQDIVHGVPLHWPRLK
jgi:hypothetical protein